MDRCEKLRWKGMFIEAEWDPTVQHCNDRAFWCQHTATVWARTARSSTNTSAVRPATATKSCNGWRQAEFEPALLLPPAALCYNRNIILGGAGCTKFWVRLSFPWLWPRGFSAGIPSHSIYGDYVEARTADVYTGPCFANSEVGLVGELAVFGWKINKGSWHGVSLDGLVGRGCRESRGTLWAMFTSPLIR